MQNHHIKKLISQNQQLEDLFSMREDDLKMPHSAEKKLLKFIQKDEGLIIPLTPSRKSVNDLNFSVINE
jgi:hypothetical protein